MFNTCKPHQTVLGWFLMFLSFIISIFCINYYNQLDEKKSVDSFGFIISIIFVSIFVLLVVIRMLPENTLGTISNLFR